MSGVHKLEFQGFSISSNDIKHSTKELAKLNEFPPPNNCKSLCQFLGMANFYRNLVPCFSDLVFLLIECVCMNPKSKDLTLKTKKSFETIKKDFIKYNCSHLPQLKC